MADDYLVSGFPCSYCETLRTRTDFNCTDDEFTKAKQFKTEKKEYVLQCTDCEDAIGDVEDAIHSETSLIEDPADCEALSVRWFEKEGAVSGRYQVFQQDLRHVTYYLILQHYSFWKRLYLL